MPVPREAVIGPRAGRDFIIGANWGEFGGNVIS